MEREGRPARSIAPREKGKEERGSRGKDHAHLHEKGGPRFRGVGGGGRGGKDLSSEVMREERNTKGLRLGEGRAAAPCEGGKKKKGFLLSVPKEAHVPVPVPKRHLVTIQKGKRKGLAA